MLFIDVRGFTALAEKLPPAEVAQRLNRFYSLASQTVFNYNGTLDKMVGDQVMAFFGAPFRRKDHAKRAVKTAVRILKALNELVGSEHLEVGAGIATGEAFVGNVGAGPMTDFTAVGDTVNVAARLQEAAAAGEILISEKTFGSVQSEFPDAPWRDLAVKGKRESVRVRVIVA